MLSSSCDSNEKDESFGIFHLAPDVIQTDSDESAIHGQFATSRSDFFVVKGYDIENEDHKLKIDNFIVDYLKAQDFLARETNAEWILTFFRYGDGIDENTVHQYDTDYTIHTLFAQEKEIGVFTFDTRSGYTESSYWIDQEAFEYDEKKRKAISDYFESIVTEGHSD